MKAMNRTIVVAAVLAAQCLAIGWLIYRYERVVTHGVEVRFKCQAYDPYDPLRGRYLDTTVRETTVNFPKSITYDTWRYRNKCVVRLEPSTNGLWKVAEAAFEPTGDGIWVNPKGSYVDYQLTWSDKKDDETYEEFYERQSESGMVATVDFPNQLFVNEKLAPEAEKLLREHTGDAVAVYRVLNGEMVITDIEIGGIPILRCVK